MERDHSVEINDSTRCPDTTDIALLEEIERILSEGSDVDMDTDRLEECLSILQASSPVMEDYDAVAEWNADKKSHPVLFKSQPFWKRFLQIKPHGIRVAYTAGMAIAIIFCLVITAHAFGKEPFGMFLNWANGIIQTYSRKPDNMLLPPDNPSEYHSLAEALEANGVDSSGCPQWVPKDYILSQVSTKKSEGLTRVYCIYEADRGELLIRATIFEDDAWGFSLERDEGGNIFKEGDTEFYIVTNMEQIKAGWLTEHCFYELSGQISEDELMQVIKSIGEV
ncbi:DUF4367 domain-containing protein [Bacteroides caecimuris]|uniref:DUF4367 domain-containing protein n=1 Tax=Bacteroides caecimuris TaxID=1796613 RepID=UPI0025744C50|nr:DUF4367 domain-containing protein [Bacteroides caecimuris]